MRPENPTGLPASPSIAQRRKAIYGGAV